MWDALWLDVSAATLVAGAADSGLRPDAAIAISDGQIAWLGPRAALTAAPERLARAVHRGGGRLLTPGLIDCHTHLVFGGDRALDYELRAEGASYAAIAAAGGGIRSTVALTAALSAEELAAAAAPRARALIADGVTTLEVKSGYGLDVAGELKLLEAARLLGAMLDVELVPTLLALHALPAEFAADRAGYIDLVTRELIPEVARTRLAVAVDVFCETIAFTVAECARVLEVARAHGLAVKVHADQLSDMGAARLAAEHGALSADHLEYTSADGVAALAASGTVAVLLPGAYLTLRETHPPPVAALRAAGVPIAVATDLNPGTSPCTSLTLALALARAQFGLTAAEALAGATRNAARALGLLYSRGTLEPGKRADFCLWDLGHPREMGYWLGDGGCHTVVRRGCVVRADEAPFP
jgi:imidazolonepropionase